MNIARPLSIGLLSVTAAAGLAACSSSGGNTQAVSKTGSYCTDFKQSANYFTSQSTTTPDYPKLIGTFRQLQNEAPAAVKGDWDSIVGFYDSLNSTLTASGLTLSNLSSTGSLTAAQKAKLQTVEAKFAKQADSLTDKESAISTDTKSRCGFDPDKGSTSDSGSGSFSATATPAPSSS